MFYLGGGAGQKALSVFLISHSATSSAMSAFLFSGTGLGFQPGWEETSL